MYKRQADIDKKTEALTDLASKLAERLYAQQPPGAGGPDMGGEQPSSGPSESGKAEDVVDAEFEEVKDDHKK